MKQAQTSKRSFLIRGLALAAWASLVGALGLGLGAVLRFAGAGQKSGPSRVEFDSEPGQGQVAVKDRVALLSDDKGLFALSLICPHLGCRPAFHPEQNIFLCPCHGSSFAPDGSLARGPAARGLPHLRVTRQGDKLVVETGQESPPAARLPQKGAA